MTDTDDFPALAQARALWAGKDKARALAAFAAASDERPANLKARLEHAAALNQSYELGAALEMLATARDLAGSDPRLLTPVAAGYAAAFREGTAIAILDAIPDRSAQARAELAALYERTGRLDDALEELQACRKLAPDAAEPRLAEARLLRRMGRTADAAALLDGLTAPQLPAQIRVEAWTEQSYLADRAGDAEAAVSAIACAHEIMRQQSGTADLMSRARANNATIAKLGRDFRASTLARWRHRPQPATSQTRLAHLIGFPRSGTTLLEQLLDAHPDIVASPERAVFTQDVLPRLVQAGDGTLSINGFDAVGPADARAIRDRYIRYMELARDTVLDGRLHIDKNPNHTGLLPGLLALDPSARFIVALRDPRDVVTSCVMRSFQLTEFSAMLLDWGDACALYAVEMGAWLRYRDRLDPDQWVETRYEDLVADPRAEVARILPTLALSWHDDVRDYRAKLTDKVVNSPTHAEVRQPVHDRAIGRWTAYAQHLAPHLHHLAPFFRAFGYS